MESIRHFLRIFYDLSVYRSLVNQPIKRSVLAVLAFHLTVGLGIAFSSYIWLLPPLAHYAKQAAATIVPAIPEEASFSLTKEGILTVTGLPAPLTVTLPPVPYTQEELSIEVDPSKTIVEAATSAATIMVTRDGARFNSTATEESYIERYPTVLEDEAATISGVALQTNIRNAVNQLSAYLPHIAIVMGLLSGLTLFISRMIATLMYGFIFWLGSFIFSRTYSYGSFINIAAYTGLVADAINIAVLLLYREPHFYIGQIAFIAVTLLVYFSLPVNRRDLQ